MSLTTMKLMPQNNYVEQGPMWVPTFVGDVALIIGNGESRSWYQPCHQTITRDGVDTWGCNAIYRDGKVDNLVATDPPMQQEIYKSGYAIHHTCWFLEWSKVPATIGDTFLMGYNIPDDLVNVHQESGATECVIRGNDPVTLQEKVELAVKLNPQMDKADLIRKMEKDMGVWITQLKDDDGVISVEYPRGWSTGCTAMHIASQEDYKEVYILGFDLSDYNEPLNNIYKGSENYLPADSKGFSCSNWVHQMVTTFREFPEIQYYWVDPNTDDAFEILNENSNVGYLTKDDLCSKLKIL